ncbi:MAG: flagellar biosynthetic protein FliR [Bryobacterales bacterium]|jgi:flagellar biosynthetic protein FliR|nr:flagellar biosynthetic protein FliR [Bryobacterales bacterium]
MDLLDGLGRILSAAGFRGSLQGTLLLYGLVMARFSIAVSLAPFLGGRAVPAQARVGLAAVITLLVAPHLVAPTEVSPIAALALLAKEVVIGAILGYLAQLVFLAIEMAGALIDNQRGMNQISLYTPQLQGPASLLGMLQVQAAIALFVTFDGHLYFLRALTDSFTALPAATLPTLRAGGLAIADLVTRLTADLFVIAVRIAAPVLLALFLVDIVFGVFNRMAAQVPVHQENQTAKAWVSLLFLLLALPLLLTQLRIWPQQLFGQMEALMAGFR